MFEEMDHEHNREELSFQNSSIDYWCCQRHYSSFMIFLAFSLYDLLDLDLER